MPAGNAVEPDNAGADPDPSSTGGGEYGPTQHTPESLAAANSSERLWKAYEEFVDGAMSATDFRRLEVSTFQERGLAAPAPMAALSCPPSDPCPPVQRVLAVPHKPQSNNNNCGPASGVMIAAFRGKTNSAADGSFLRQANMASWTHMRTDYYGKTEYSRLNFTRGLNRWLFNQDVARYTQHDNPSVSTFKGALRYNVDALYPIGVSTVEWAGLQSDRYNEHPHSVKAIGHWIVGRGYGQSGDASYFMDPATSVWGDVKPSFSRSTAGFVPSFVNNGISA